MFSSRATPGATATARARATATATRRARARAATATRATPSDDRARDLFAKLYPSGTGKSIYYGVFQRDARAGERKSDDERRKLRDDAAVNLTNIDADERGRRMVVGKAAGALTAAVAVAQTALGATRVERLCVAIPLFFALGFAGSAKTGL